MRLTVQVVQFIGSWPAIRKTGSYKQRIQLWLRLLISLAMLALDRGFPASTIASMPYHRSPDPFPIIISIHSPHYSSLSLIVVRHGEFEYLIVPWIEKSVWIKNSEIEAIHTWILIRINWSVRQLCLKFKNAKYKDSTVRGRSWLQVYLWPHLLFPASETPHIVSAAERKARDASHDQEEGANRFARHF